MSNSVQNVNKINAGTCPHGCAPGACPICSGMGGGSLRPGERPQKPGEMSYHQCAMIGAMMKARAASTAEHEKNLKLHADAIKVFEQHLEKISTRITAFANKISNSLLLKPLGFVIKFVTSPIFFSVKTITSVIQTVLDKFTQLKIDIQDKLNAVFGEAKAFIDKKVSELISTLKSKLENLFKIFKQNKTKDDETKIDEDKKIFRLKNFINKIWKKDKDGAAEN